MNNWTEIINENRSDIKDALKEALEKSLNNSMMKYEVYITSEGDTYTREVLSGDTSYLTNDDLFLICTFDGEGWLWDDYVSYEDALAACLKESDAEARDAYKLWMAENEYNENTPASDLYSWWKDSYAAGICKISAIADIVADHDFDADVNDALAEAERE